jgi:hypothetical protein
MSGKWHGFFEVRGDDVVPHVAELSEPSKGCSRTRAGAIAVLRQHMEHEHKAAQAKAAQIGRTLAALLELEERP